MVKKILLFGYNLFFVACLNGTVDPINLCSLFERCKSSNVRTIDFMFADINGTLRSVTLPIDCAAQACAQGIAFDGSSVPGCTAIFESDMHLKPDISSFNIIEGTEYACARVMCDVCLSQDEIYEADPRTLLKQKLEEIHEQGLEFYVGPELEFFLFEDEQHLNPIDNHTYCRAHTTDKQKKMLIELLASLQHNHINVEKLHHEVACGQYEISIRYADALSIADQILMAKHIIHEFAHAHGMRATFMPKPLAGVNGSGMHVHCSMYDTINDKNIFFDPNDPLYLSEYAKQFTAGILNHISGMCAFTNPTINSYKRLVAGFEAPVYVCWSRSNRSALIRVPQIPVFQPRSARIELRSSDAMANPYLLFSLMLCAGLDGVTSKMDAPACVDHDVYKITGDQLVRKGIRTLHPTLDKAIEGAMSNAFVRKTLGEKCLAEFFKIKRQEVQEYNAYISQWELATYL